MEVQEPGWAGSWPPKAEWPCFELETTKRVPLHNEAWRVPVGKEPGGRGRPERDQRNSGLKAATSSTMRPSTPVRETLSAGSHKVTVRGKAAEKTFVVDVPAGGTIKKEIALE